MRRASALGISLFIVAIFLSSSSVLGAASCIICHTNESIIKSMYRPPQISGGEGEG